MVRLARYAVEVAKRWTPVNVDRGSRPTGKPAPGASSETRIAPRMTWTRRSGRSASLSISSSRAPGIPDSRRSCTSFTPPTTEPGGSSRWPLRHSTSFTRRTEILANGRAGRALLVKAVYSFYEGNAEEALQLNGIGLESIDKQRDPDLFFMSIHNRVLFVLESGRYRDARMELFRYQLELNNAGGRAYATRLLWLRARICAGLKEWSSAEQAFVEVKKGWEELSMKLHAALASLELAPILMRLGRCCETEALVMEAAEIFVDLRIQREAIGAVMVLRDSFKRKLGTLEHLEDVVNFLRRWHLDPNTKFVPRGRVAGRSSP